MKDRKSLKFIFLLFLVMLNIGCDQVSKTIVRRQLDFSTNIGFLNNHLTLTKVENTGAFLSTGDNLPKVLRLALLSVFPLAALAYGLYYLFTTTSLPRPMQMGISFIIGGGIGNVYDRIKFGAVTDFLHIDFGLFRTGIFNMADLSIMVGIGILLFYSIRKKIISPSLTDN